ncbi:hypothetical protein Riv7116_3974 [Rivularia sp. PCC 7116]|nr:hypothetical protein Riv7116_3974 [Rivularia sp. PCC 7116]
MTAISDSKFRTSTLTSAKKFGVAQLKYEFVF